MKTRIATLLVALATLCGLQAQTAADGALYVYRTDGRFTVFSAADVDSITYSRYDAQGQLHDSWQMQLVHTRGSVTAIPLSVIDSVSLATPQAGTKGIDYVEQPAADVQGAGTAASPYMTVSAAPLGVSLQAECHYTDARGQLHTYSPQATLSLTARRAMAVAADAEALGTQIQTADGTLTTEGTAPAVHTYRQTLATSGAEGQQFDVELRYEAYTAADGTALPYLQLSEPRLVGIEVKERSATRLTTTVYDTVRYDVTARFEVDVEAVNTTDALSQTLTLAMHYEGGVVNAQEVEVELVKTEYRKDMIVYDGHDNLDLRAQAVVYRDRYYSDGSIHTDSLKEMFPMDLYDSNIANNPRGTLIADVGDGISGTYLIADGLTMQYTRHEEFVNVYTACTFKYVNSIGVPDLGCLSGSAVNALDWTDEINAIGHPSKDLSEYRIFGFDTYYDASNPQDGIYIYPVDNSVDNNVSYKHNSKYYDFICPRFAFIWYDRIASMDGELITFEEFRPTIKDISNFWDYEEVESSHGPARVYKAEATGMYLGKEMHLISIDTVYVVKQDPTAMLDVTTHAATDITASSVKLSCKLAEEQEVPLENVDFVVYGGTYNKVVACVKATERTAEGEYVVTTDAVFANATFSYNVMATGNDGAKYWGQTQTFTTPATYTEDDAVDLGLSVKWANCKNVGADYSFPYEGNWDYPLTYTVTETEWSDGWRLPTQAEWQELCDKCGWEYKERYNGRYSEGYVITGPNGNSIYLPVNSSGGDNYQIAAPNNGKTFYINGYYRCDFVTDSNDGRVRLVRDK
ncbi:MAG: hypothetical protein IJA98_03490 [Bacteroidaceae bacterium]|nr:hypothetical protein [Bacteroidaceae bacterium]